MTVYRAVLGAGALLGAVACSDSSIEGPTGMAVDDSTTTTVGTMSTSGGTDASSTEGTTSGSTTGGLSTSTGAPTGTPTTTGSTGMANGSTTGTGSGGAMAAGGATGARDSTTDGNAFGGSANDDGGEDTTGTTGAGGQTSTDECSLMLGDVPVCCTPQGENRANVDEVFELLNAYRISQGRDALAQDPLLEEAMQGHCMHMDQADFFDHISPVADLAEPWDRADLCGTRANAENIAWNQRSPAAVMEAWQNSSGHNQNMLTNNSTRVGIGEYNLYWGQIFGP